MVRHFVERCKRISWRQRTNSMRLRGSRSLRRSLSLESTGSNGSSLFGFMVSFQIEPNKNNSFPSITVDSRFWEVSQIPAWKKRVVSLVFSELPRGTVNDALKKFVLAEEISPGFYSKNLLMIIKCYIALNGKTQAKEFSKILMNRQRKTKEDEEVRFSITE